MNVVQSAMDVFEQLGLQASPVDAVDRAVDRAVDLVLGIDGTSVPIQLKYRSLITDDVAAKLLRLRASDAVLLVVGDRVTTSARSLLLSGGAGYLDLRGHIQLRAPGVLIAADIRTGPPAAVRTDGLGGRVGLEVAAALLMQSPRPGSVRPLARELGRSPSTVSSVLKAFRRDGLVDDDNTVIGTDLFWKLSDRWSSPRVHLAKLPLEILGAAPTQGQSDRSAGAALGLGLDNAEHCTGWALTDTAAAAVYGAPVAFRSTQILDFFVPGQSELRRAQRLLGEVGSTGRAKITVRIAPVAAAVDRRITLATNPNEFPLAHPLFVALDLAQDVGRGREILESWTPPSRWNRAW